MIEGEVGTVRVEDIIILRRDRIRKELDPGRVAELADSIARLGLIHPPVITRERVLVSGETRLAAIKSLGWDKVTVTWAESLDPKVLLSIELEENVKRTDLPWQDQCDAVYRFHDLQTELHDTWSLTETATALGMALGSVHEKIAVAKEILSGNERVAAAPVFSTAKNIVKRATERREQDAQALINTIEEVPEKEASPILLADFRSWVDSYSGPPFNLLHADFPYGINADKFNQSAGKEFGSYSDTPENYFALIQTLLDNKEKLLGDSAHIIFWFSMQHYAATLDLLRSTFWVDPYPLIWVKSDNKGTLPDPQRGPRRIYEVAFICSYGDRKIIRSTSNVCSVPTERTAGHMSEKNQTMLEHFFKMVVDENTRLLDPTCGSGSALRAADALGAASVLGLEVNPEFVENARRAWEQREPRLEL